MKVLFARLHKKRDLQASAQSIASSAISNAVAVPLHRTVALFMQSADLRQAHDRPPDAIQAERTYLR